MDVNTPTVLVVEDDESLRLVLADNLEEAGYRVLVAPTVAEATRLWDAERPDLVVLDLMLPDGDGYSLCQRQRAAGSEAAVLMLTARSLEDDLVGGLDAGADDYLTKPYRLRELLARIRALLRGRTRGRRGVADGTQRLQAGHWQLDLDARTVTHRQRGDAAALTRTEFDLLVLLVRSEGAVRTRSEILDSVWGAEVVVEPRTVDNFISTLKRKLRVSSDSGFEIRTVRGVGYLLNSASVQET